MAGDRHTDSGWNEGFDAVEAPDLIAPVHAFRDWRITDDGLCSPRTAAIWTDRVMRAQCRPQAVEALAQPRHAAPGSGCTCGIHGHYGFSDEASKVDWRGVSGIVTVWGRVEAHATGLRAEFARVEALGTYRRWTRRQKAAVAAVADHFGVALVDLYDLPQVARQFGTRMPEALIPGGVLRERAWSTSFGAQRDERRVVVAA